MMRYDVDISLEYILIDLAEMARYILQDLSNWDCHTYLHGSLMKFICRLSNQGRGQRCNQVP